jgi:fructose-bisphosphate aldolase class II
MGLTITQIRDNTTRARHLYQRTRSQHFAVGAFNIDNQETLIAVARAAQKLQSPVLVVLSRICVIVSPMLEHAPYLVVF